MSRSYSSFSLVIQLFLLFTFLCAPIAETAHALRMSQAGNAIAKNAGDETVVKQKPSIRMAAAPCHEAMMSRVEKSASQKIRENHSDDAKPCCPHKQCSPDNCLMHFAIASMIRQEVFPHAPEQDRVFVYSRILALPAPDSERLRPPIA